MSIFDIFKKPTPVTLAKSQKIKLVELHRQTEYLSKKDIGAWRRAWQRAINIEWPNRNELYDIYTDVAIDLHVSGCVDQRKGFVKKKNFKLVDKDGKTNEDATTLLKTEWFDNFVDIVLDSRYYGHSLIELGAPADINGKRQYSYVRAVPRKHVCPEFGTIKRQQNDDPRKGIPFRNGEIANWCVEVGQPYDLGLFLKCAPSALSKKNMLSFWDGFGEIFGMPIRIARTTSRDESERSQLDNMLSKMGAAFYGVFPEGTDIEIKESTKGDAYNVYDQRINRANSEISKGILNQTMTIDSGSSLSQSEVHLEVFENVIEADRKLVINVVNNKLLPLMERHGFNVGGLKFEYDNAISYSPEQIQQVEQMLISGGFEIDPKYFVNKYGIDVTGVRDWGNSELARLMTRGDRDFFL